MAPSHLRALTVPCPTADPLHALARGGLPSAYFECPARGQAALGLGVLREARAQDAAELARLLETLTGPDGEVHALDEASAHVPGPWFGGMAFDPHRTGEAQGWSGFGAGRWVVPRHLLWRTQGGALRVTRFLLPDESPEAARGELAGLLEHLSPSEPGPAAPWSGRVTEARGECYRRAVERALGCIEAGGLRKVMVARALDVEGTRPFPVPDVLRHLRARFPTCATFLLQGADGALFLGATPEHLCQLEGGVLSTEALAGTSRPDQAEALLRSEKDLREHRAVVDGIRAALAPCALSFEAADAPGLKRLPNVAHLHTPIRATLQPGTPAAAVLRALHPTPSVGGTPRERAFSFLAEHEGLERGWYAGPIGLFGARAVEAYVALRCALVKGAWARVYVGAGIVAGSTPEAELRETGLKARVLLEALGAEGEGPLPVTPAVASARG